MRTKTKRRSLLTLAAMLMTTVVVVLGPASPADAAGPNCDGWAYVQGNHVFDWDIIVDAVYLMPVKHYDGWNDWSCNMRSGDTGEDVRRLQGTLNHCYSWYTNETLSTDGQFGTATRRVLTKVQGLLRISADGQYGPQTARTMSHPMWTPGWPSDYWQCEQYRQF